MRWKEDRINGYRTHTVQVSLAELLYDQEVKKRCGCKAILRGDKKIFIPCRKRHEFGSIEVVKDGEVIESYA